MSAPTLDLIAQFRQRVEEHKARGQVGVLCYPEEAEALLAAHDRLAAERDFLRLELEAVRLENLGVRADSTALRDFLRLELEAVRLENLGVRADSTALRTENAALREEVARLREKAQILDSIAEAAEHLVPKVASAPSGIYSIQITGNVRAALDAALDAARAPHPTTETERR